MRIYFLIEQHDFVQKQRQSQNLYSGDERLFNQYGVVIINPQMPHETELAEKFSEWLRSVDGQAAINNYKIDG